MFFLSREEQRLEEKGKAKHLLLGDRVLLGQQRRDNVGGILASEQVSKGASGDWGFRQEAFGK